MRLSLRREVCNAKYYVRVLTEFSPAAEMPEPGGVVLFGSGLAVVAILSRLKRHVRS